jgi:hypothetical protein
VVVVVEVKWQVGFEVPAVVTMKNIVLWAGLSLAQSSSGFLHGLLFDLEDGGSMFFRNRLSHNYTVSQPRTPILLKCELLLSK